jgi:hypothetical protein
MHRFFSVAQPFHQDPAAPAGGQSQGAGPVCEFCGCKLGADGAVLKTSERAKLLARVDERIERLEADLAGARARVTEVEGQLAAASTELQQLRQGPRPAPAAERHGLHFDN